MNNSRLNVDFKEIEMERLTTKELYGKREMVCRFEDCETVEENCPHINEDNCFCLQSILKRLGEYEDMEEQGLILIAPCKIGDIVFEASKAWGKVIERTVANIVFCPENHIYIRNGCGDSFEFGVEVFLTREQAEQALKEMQTSQ